MSQFNNKSIEKLNPSEEEEEEQQQQQQRQQSQEGRKRSLSTSLKEQAKMIIKLGKFGSSSSQHQQQTPTQQRQQSDSSLLQFASTGHPSADLSGTEGMQMSPPIHHHHRGIQPASGHLEVLTPSGLESPISENWKRIASETSPAIGARSASKGADASVQDSEGPPDGRPSGQSEDSPSEITPSEMTPLISPSKAPPAQVTSPRSATPNVQIVAASPPQTQTVAGAKPFFDNSPPIKLPLRSSTLNMYAGGGQGGDATRSATPFYPGVSGLGLGGFAASSSNLDNRGHPSQQQQQQHAFGLESLLLNTKISREETINFLKLDEYFEGLSVRQKKKKVIPRQSSSASVQIPMSSTAVKDSFSLSRNYLQQQQKLKQKQLAHLVYYSTDYGRVQGDSLEDLNHTYVDSPDGSDQHQQPSSYQRDQELTLNTLLRSQYFWIDVFDPNEEEMKLFASIFNIHPLTMEDVMTDSSREKFELYRNYYFICYSAFDSDPDSQFYMQSFNIYILVYSCFCLTFHYYPMQAVDDVIRRLDQLKHYMKITPHWINYALLDDITDKYLPLIHSLELEVDSIDDLVLVISQTEQSDMLRRIANARKRVMNLQRSLVAKSDVLRILIKRLDGMSAGISPSAMVETSSLMLRDTALYLGDVQDHAITMVQTLAHVDTTLNRCHSNYLAQINIELTVSSNTANDAVAKLTALASILVPLNVITGLWGMNVHVPGQSTGAQDEGFGWFLGLLVAMLVIVLGGLVSLKLMGLLDDRRKRSKKR